jgi:hypothetical protein
MSMRIAAPATVTMGNVLGIEILNRGLACTHDCLAACLSTMNSDTWSERHGLPGTVCKKNCDTCPVMMWRVLQDSVAHRTAIGFDDDSNTALYSTPQSHRQTTTAAIMLEILCKNRRSAQ